MRLDVEVGVLALNVFQGIGVGHQVAAHPVGVDELLDPGHLVDLVHRIDLDVDAPAHRLVRDPEGLEDLVVEALLTEQELVDDPQELAAAGTLDDAMVIGGGQGDGLADRVPGQRLVAGALKRGGVFKGAGPDDAGLALRQARN